MLSTNNGYRSLLIAILSVLLWASLALGQITNVTDDTSTPIPGAGHDYIKMLSETVNPANGSVSVRIQVPVPKGRQLTVPFSFAYDSNGVYHLTGDGHGGSNWLSNTTFLSQGGWSYSVPMSSAGGTTESYMMYGQNYTCTYYTDYLFQDPSGGRHPLHLAVAENGTPGCQNAPYIPFSNMPGGDDFFLASTPASPSGQPLVLAPPLTVSDLDGTVYYFSNPANHGSVSTNVGASLPDWIKDRNGNTVTVYDANLHGGALGAFSFTDTMNRTSISSDGFGSTGTTNHLAVSGLSNPYQIYWGSASAYYSVPTTRINSNQYIYCQAPPGISGSQPVVSTITLPDNVHQYQFFYDPTYGLLSEIIYPDGGKVEYTWGLNYSSELVGYPDLNGVLDGCQYIYATPAVTKRVVKFDGETPALEQDFAYPTGTSTVWNPAGYWTSKQTVVTTTDLLRPGHPSTITTYDYVGDPAVWDGEMPPNETSLTASQIPVEHQVTYADSSGNPLKIVTKGWQDASQLLCEEDTLVDTGQISGVFYAYQFSLPGYGYGAVMTTKKEYDYGLINSTSTCTSNQNGISAPGSPTRETDITYQTFSTTPSGGTILDRPLNVLISGAGSAAAQTQYYYDNQAGNATKKTVKCLYNCLQDSVTNYTYDGNGQQTSMQDPNLNTTHYYYNDGYDGYLTQITYPNTGVAHIVYFGYDHDSGALTSSTDQNSQVTDYIHNDLLGRLKEIDYPDPGKTTYDYGGNACASPSTTNILLSGSSNYYTESASMDGFCQVTRKTITSDPAGYDYADTAYDGLGRVWTVSNPYRSQSESSYGVTTTTYDALGRVGDLGTTKSIVYPDGSATSTTYSGNSTIVTDPALKTRTLTSDALGRLTSVNEAGLYSTDYTYDALDNLLTVSQGGQTRSFTYDSLSRLYQAQNPESSVGGTQCTTTYNYDPNGNLISKVAPLENQNASCNNTVTTTYTPDALNRVTDKTYNDGVTPPAHFAYDESSVSLGSCSNSSIGYSVGRLTHTTTGSAGAYLTATVESYDPMGRAAGHWQATPSYCGTNMWATLYNYDKAGDLTSWVHPAGFTITQGPPDGARHVIQVASSLSDTTHPATLATGPGNSIQYTAWGATSQLQNGCAGSGCTPSVQETYLYNKRLQMAVAELATASGNTCREYSYYANTTPSGCSESSSSWPTGNTNNGNVAGYYHADTMNASLSHTGSYFYDPVNRLTNAYATPFGTGTVSYNQTFTYTGDGSNGQYGNMNCSPAGPGCVAFTYSAATNHITTSGYNYDAAGNLIGDGTNTYQWDAEGHLIAVIDGAGRTVSFNTYNALGQRVRDVTLTGTTEEAYGAGGNLLWRFTGDSNDRKFVPFNGTILAEYWSGGTLFDHPDELGSITAGTSYDGSACQERLFYPFGESWTGVNLNNCNMHQTFAQLPDYDAETDQYNTLARHYSPSGRWMSPDDFHNSKVADPQSWNLYAYGESNPLRYVDPTGSKATVSVTCTTQDDQMTCSVNISASITIYDANGIGSRLSQQALKDAASTIRTSIDSAWNGSFQQDGVTYNVSTQVSVQVADSQDAAMTSGAQNVIGISNGSASGREDSYVEPRSVVGAITGIGPDTGVWNFNDLATGAKHEFTHLLGTGDKPGEVVSNTTYSGKPEKPTAQDLFWGIAEAVKSVEFQRQAMSNVCPACSISTTATVWAGDNKKHWWVK